MKCVEPNQLYNIYTSNSVQHTNTHTLLFDTHFSRIRTTNENNNEINSNRASTSESIGIVVALVIIIRSVHTQSEWKRVHRRNNQKWKRNSYSHREKQKKSIRTKKKQWKHGREQWKHNWSECWWYVCISFKLCTDADTLSKTHAAPFLCVFFFYSFFMPACAFFPSSLCSALLPEFYVGLFFALHSVFVSFSFYALDIFFSPS